MSRVFHGPVGRTALACLATVGAVVALSGAAFPRAAFPDGPPAAVTGGFGEDSCLSCHLGSALNEPGGTIEVLGLPDQYEPGRSYTLRLTLTRGGMAVGGFQLATRHADGSQAGSLEPAAEEGQRMAVQKHRDVQYLQHLLDGITPSAPDTIAWSAIWTAPTEGGAVSFHAAAVAGDKDESQMGDYVYTLERQLVAPKR